MRALILVGLAACSFAPGIVPGDGGGSGDGGNNGGGDGSTCGWSYTPTNFMPCALPPPAPLTVSSEMTLDVGTTTLPKLVVTQSDGTQITVIHLTQLTVNATLIVNGSTGVVFAVKGEALISDTIVAVAGSDNAIQCATAKGSAGADSLNANGGGGGGGGAAGNDVGGNGGNGAGTQAGSGGPRGARVASSLSPLRGGCPGGNGGRPNGVGTAPIGGRGGGALQISSDARIEITSDARLDANGRGGAGGNAAQIGGAGAGSGGGIFLEAPTIELELLSHICADGGSGGNGAAAAAGTNGVTGTCNGSYAITPSPVVTSAGLGGAGSYALKTAGGNATSATSNAAGGGGGGGGVGWIRIKTPDLHNGGSLITPLP